MSLLSLFRRKPRSKVFRYFDGRRERGIDPMVVMRELSCHPVFNFQVHPGLANLTAPEGASPEEVKRAMQTASEAALICSATAMEVFCLAPYDPETDTGLTETQALEVLDSFCAWFESLKNDIAGRPIS